MSLLQPANVFNLTNPVQDRDMEILYLFYTGYQAQVVTDTWANVLTPTELAELQGYQLVLNLTAPSVNRLTSGVYGGTVSRTIESDSIYRNELEAILSPGRGYGQLMRQWFSNAVLFGTAWLIWEVKDDRPVPRLANPIFTEVTTDRFDCSIVTSLKEHSPNGDGYWREVTDTHYRVGKDEDILETVGHGLGFAPVLTIYGESLTAFGKHKGLSLVRDSVSYAKVISRLTLNLIQLIKLFSRPQPTLVGEPNLVSEDVGEAEAELQQAFLPGGVLPLKEGGRFSFESPNAEFRQILETIQHLVKQYCLSMGIPLDALDPSVIPENQSATSARLRHQPLATQLQRLTEDMKIAEIKSLQVAAAIIQWLDTDGGDVTFRDIQDKVKVNISMQPVQPESQNEEVSAWIQLYQVGAKTMGDLIRHFNGNLSETEIQRRISSASEKTMSSTLVMPATQSALKTTTVPAPEIVTQTT